MQCASYFGEPAKCGNSWLEDIRFRFCARVATRKLPIKFIIGRKSEREQLPFLCKELIINSPDKIYIIGTLRNLSRKFWKYFCWRCGSHFYLRFFIERVVCNVTPRGSQYMNKVYSLWSEINDVHLILKAIIYVSGSVN